MLTRIADGSIRDLRTPMWLVTLMARASLSERLKIGPEDRVGIEFGNRLRAWALEGRLTATFTHVPHEVGGGGGKKSSARYAIAKALGLIAGSGDYVFVAPDGGGWIEAKSDVGRLNPAQKLFKDWCELRGVRYRVMRSADEGEAILKEWGMLI